MIINSSARNIDTINRTGNREKTLPSEMEQKDRVTITGETEQSKLNPLEMFAINSVTDKQSGKMELASREYKILLKPENFKNPEDGIKKFWKKIKNIAEEEGLSVEDRSSDIGDPRYVTYLDTPDFALNKLGYVLRRRQKNELKSGGDDRGKKYELTLKYRNKDVNISAGKDVSPSEEYDGSVKFEDDIVAGGNEIKSVYSKSGKVELKEETGNTLEDYTEIFPGLKDTGLSPESKLKKVNNKKIEEYKMDLGDIDFGGVTGGASLSVWFNQGEGKDGDAVIGEFSFSYDINDSENKDRINNFVKAIQKELSSFIAEGITKTELIYGQKEN